MISTWELLLIAVGLAMDAFAVSISKGLCVDKATPKRAAIVGLYFGGFQALMPVVGYLLGSRLGGYITRFDHWIAFVLLVGIGAKMVHESRGDDGGDDRFDVRAMLPLAIATSIDALAVGVSFAFLNVDIQAAAILIGVVTFAVSAIGLKIGNIFGLRYRSSAELLGGIILIAMGVKILLEHLGIVG